MAIILETTYDDANRMVKRTFSGDASYLKTTVYDRRGIRHFH